MIYRVRNMLSPRGKEVANQFIIRAGDRTIFQSYDSVIAIKEMPYVNKNGDVVAEHIILDKDYWDYSTTTGKYRNAFLGENKQETAKKIKSGEYTLAKLN